ncbi:histamine H3 receptor-like [Diadema antillarum]|uniref:histamine H3 receptor-like n=1 Tax=Diadema antillarum TaxID=105358 RepID=UPI003A8C528E
MNLNSTFAHGGKSSLITSSASSMVSSSFVLTIIPYCVLITVTIVGNILVIASYARDVELRRRVSNLIILNLAVADLLVGAISLSVNLSKIISGSWMFGQYACKLYAVVDYVSVTQSIAMILFITDRLYLLKKQIRYAAFMTHRRVLVAIIVTWLLVITFWSTIAFGWTAFVGRTSGVDFDRECLMEYLTSPFATLVISTTMCSVPFVGVWVLNFFIFIHIKRQWSQFQRIKLKRSISETYLNSSCRTSGKPTNLSVARLSEFRSCEVNKPKGEAKSSIKTISQTICIDRNSNLAVSHGDRSPEARLRRSLRQSLKIARRLAPLVVVFNLCWLPYNIITIVSAFCGGSCVSKVVWDVAENIVWANSALNPILYAVTNKGYRRNFSKFICCRCTSGKAVRH